MHRPFSATIGSEPTLGGQNGHFKFYFQLNKTVINRAFVLLVSIDCQLKSRLYIKNTEVFAGPAT